MTQALVKFTKPDLPATWDYDESVAKVKRVIFKWHLMNRAMFEELWTARAILSRVGNPNWKKSSNSKTWNDYCRDIGSSRQVVNRWLAAFYGKVNGNGRAFLPITDRDVEIRQCDFRELLGDLRDLDAIITDPPLSR